MNFVPSTQPIHSEKKEDKKKSVNSANDSVSELEAHLRTIRSRLQSLSSAGCSDINVLLPIQDQLIKLENENKKDGVWCGDVSDDNIPAGQGQLDELLSACHNIVDTIKIRSETPYLVDPSLQPVCDSLVQIRNQLCKLWMETLNNRRNPKIYNGELQHYQHLLNELEMENKPSSLVWETKDSATDKGVLNGQATLNEVLEKSHFIIEKIRLFLENKGMDYKNKNQAQVKEHKTNK
jgi:hypothetical protein